MTLILAVLIDRHSLAFLSQEFKIIQAIAIFILFRTCNPFFFLTTRLQWLLLAFTFLCWLQLPLTFVVVKLRVKRVAMLVKDVLVKLRWLSSLVLVATIRLPNRLGVLLLVLHLFALL